jgi:hypothetical protein
MKLLLAFAACIALFVVGCGDDDGVTNGQGAKVILPIKVGNLWHGDYFLYWNDSTITTTYAFHIAKDTLIQVTGGEQRWFFMEAQLAENSYLKDELYRYGNTGVEIWYNYEDSLSEPCLWAKYPASVGDTYMTGEDLLDSVIIVSTDTTVTVPNGTYRCYCYRFVKDMTTHTREEYYYLAPNVGYVKYEEFRQVVDEPKEAVSLWTLDSLVLN